VAADSVDLAAALLAEAVQAEVGNTIQNKKALQKRFFVLINSKIILHNPKQQIAKEIFKPKKE
jgi:hypothetical protein